jgi:F-type H+-transporting ATPase subunit b
VEFFRHAESWVLVSFLLFIGVLIYYKVPALVGKMLDDRAAKIAKELDDAKALRVEAESLVAQYRQKLSDAEKQAVDIIEGAKSDAAAYAEESKRKLSETIERRSKQAEYKIAQAQATAEKDVRSAAAELAISMAAQALGTQAKGKGGEGLVSDSIKAVKARLN